MALSDQAANTEFPLHRTRFLQDSSTQQCCSLHCLVAEYTGRIDYNSEDVF